MVDKRARGDRGALCPQDQGKNGSLGGGKDWAKARRWQLLAGRKDGRAGQAKAGRCLNEQVTAWSTGPVPGPDHVLGQEK